MATAVTEKNPHAVAAERAFRRAEQLHERAAAEQRDLTDEEQRQYDRDLEHANQHLTRAKHWRSLDDALAQYRTAPPADAKRLPAEARGETRGKTGKAILVPTMAEYRAAQATSPDSAGGYLVPEEIGAVVDRLRPASVFLAAQPVIVPMESMTLRFPRIGTGVVAGWYQENAPFSDDSVTFEHVTLVAKKVGGKVVASNEVLADAVDDAMRDALGWNLAREIGTAFDYGAFFGDGLDGEPTGLVNVPGVQKTPINGPLTLDDVAASIARVEAANATPSAIFLSPAAYAALRVERDSGSTTGKYQLSTDPSAAAPRTLWGVPVFLSTHLGNHAVIADMSRIVLGVRHGFVLFFDPYSLSASDQTVVRATMRLDFAPLHDAAVDVLTAIDSEGESES